jgi:hypothetical protein
MKSYKSKKRSNSSGNAAGSAGGNGSNNRSNYIRGNLMNRTYTARVTVPVISTGRADTQKWVCAS